MHKFLFISLDKCYVQLCSTRVVDAVFEVLQYNEVPRTTQQLAVTMFITQQKKPHLSALLSEVITVHILSYWRNLSPIVGDMVELAIPQKPQQLVEHNCTCGNNYWA
jgi:hypothetical protein